ncbi:carbohydrate-binding domain-containing protein [Sorangium sp. So ce854]|uniref:carbohydrate-binding domain-containing protein n=1 Tax=Sorangium sp. So ce854 TaxID=3133322 RepID=UPI003F5FD6F5
MRLRPAIALLPLVLAACVGDNDAPTSEHVDASSDELIGGRPALEAEVPATIEVSDCTGAKVGPRHFLIAAHCVDDDNTGGVGSNHLPGSTVAITDDNGPSGIQRRNLTVQETHIFPAWTSSRRSCHRHCINILNPYHPPDVAVIVVDEDTPDIPEATVDGDPVLPGTEVIIAGYGCENGVDRPTPPARLKIETVTTLPASALIHEGSYVVPEDAADVAGANVITEGVLTDPAAASLCPGDSGGPLYRTGTSQQLIVGVNSYYTFSDESGISRTNWHTRLDSAARYDVLTWLKDLGVNTQGGGPRTIPYQFTHAPLTSTIEAENFDYGYEGVAYHDTTVGNATGFYRGQHVDLEPTADTPTGPGANVTGTAAGEWLNYSVTNPFPVAYHLELRVATTGASKALHVEIDGQNVTGTVTLPATGGAQSWQTVSVPVGWVTVGPHVVRVVFETGDIHLNWLRFVE